MYLLLFLKSDYVFQSVGVCRCYGLNGSVFSFLVPHEIVLHLKINDILNGRGGYTVFVFTIIILWIMYVSAKHVMECSLLA